MFRSDLSLALFARRQKEAKQASNSTTSHHIIKPKRPSSETLRINYGRISQWCPSPQIGNQANLNPDNSTPAVQKDRISFSKM
jgi:hypothetical protein